MALSSAKKGAIRGKIAPYGYALAANEPHVHYTQQRPFKYVDDPKAKNIELDCSGTVGTVFWNAMHDTGIYIADPLNLRYTGWGNTTTLEAYLRAKGGKVTTQGFLVGDMARFGTGEHAHVIVCVKNGNRSTAVWLSHGSEGGPNLVKLSTYRDDLVGIWRHPALL